MVSLIDEFCESMATGLLNRSKEPGDDVWPQPIFGPSEGNYFAHHEIISKLDSAIRSIDEGGQNPPGIAQLLMYPSRTVQLMYLFLERAADENELSVRTRVASKLLSYVTIMRNGNPFCRNGLNLVWNQDNVSATLANSKLQEVDRLPQPSQIRSLVARLSVLLSNYCEFLYFAHLAFGREIHGPYSTNRSDMMLVREYFDLKPSFWDFSRSLPFKTVRILCTYPWSSTEFDFVGRLRTQTVLGPNLSRVYIEIDGRPHPIDAGVIQETTSSLLNCMNDAAKHIRGLGRKDLMTKWVEGYFWVLKPLQDQLGQDWHPSDDLYNRIRTQEPENWFTAVARSLASIPEPQRLALVKSLFDPRVLRK